MGAIVLDNTSKVIRITTDGTEALDVLASYIDHTSSATTAGSQETLITTAITTDIVDSPASSTQRVVSWVSITNTSATSGNVIVNYYDGTNDHEMGTFDLAENDMLIFDGQKWSVEANNGQQNYIVNGRLTLTSGTPVTTSDVTAATTWYFTPYKGNRIALYTNAKWKLYSFSEVSLAVVASTDTNYDLFLYDNSGTLTLEAVAWTNDTTRATAITLQDGVYCKSGSLDRRYLGSVRTTGTSGQCEDSESRRFVWNYYNRVNRHLEAIEPTGTWTYTTATWRSANANTSTGQTRVGILIGVSEEETKAFVLNSASNGNSCQFSGGIGISSTSTNSAQLLGAICGAGPVETGTSEYRGYPGIGYYYIQRLEISQATGTTTWRGSIAGYLQTGLHVEIMG